MIAVDAIDTAAIDTAAMGAALSYPADPVTTRDKATSAPEGEAPAAEAEPELTIDDLAARSRVPSRTIRFYQSKGLVPAPVIKGRVAIYGARHLERLELVAQLQDRGLRIDAIREIARRLDAGDLDVGEWLGLDAQLKAPWADDRPRTVTEAELLELFGRDRKGVVTDLVRHAGVERHGDTFLVRSPSLVTLAGKLEAAGIDLEISSRAGDVLKKHLERAAREVTEIFLKSAGADTDVAAAIEALRPLGLEAVRIVFAREMERVLREVVSSGRAAKLPAKRPRKK